MDTDLIQSLADLGGTLASLGFAGWLMFICSSCKSMRERSGWQRIQ